MQPMLMPGGVPALARFQVLDSRCPEEARAVVGRIFCPHFLTPVARRPAGFHARHHSAPQLGYSVNRVAYGARVEIDPGELERFFLVQIPLSGAAQVDVGRTSVAVAAGRTGSVLSPTVRTRMVWGDGCEKLIVLVNRSEVEAYHARLGGREGPVELPPELDLTGGLGLAVMRHAALMAETAERPGAPPAYQAALRDGLVSLLLDGLVRRQEEPAAGPASVRRAEAYARAHLGHALSMSDLAEAAGVGLRSLQETFRRTRGVTLTEWLQAARLEAFRKALLAADGSRSVTELALGAGLGHLGRAAAAYRVRFGETPSETLRRTRTRS